MSERELSNVAYDAYGAHTGWKNDRGDPMLQWAELPTAIQGAWRAAIVAIMWSRQRTVNGPPYVVVGEWATGAEGGDDR